MEGVSRIVLVMHAHVFRITNSAVGLVVAWTCMPTPSHSGFALFSDSFQCVWQAVSHSVAACMANVSHHHHMRPAPRAATALQAVSAKAGYNQPLAGAAGSPEERPVAPLAHGQGPGGSPGWDLETVWQRCRRVAAVRARVGPAGPGGSRAVAMRVMAAWDHWPPLATSGRVGTGRGPLVGRWARVVGHWWPVATSGGPRGAGGHR